jgi:hypothetical protein
LPVSFINSPLLLFYDESRRGRREKKTKAAGKEEEDILQMFRERRPSETLKNILLSYQDSWF